MALIELTLPVEIDEAWTHLREPALIRRWFGWEYDGLEHEIDVIFLQEARVDDASHALAWGDGLQDGDRIELADAGLGTTLTIVRDPNAPDGYDEIAEGWIQFAQQLRFALERHRGEERRTLRLTGTRPETLPDGEVFFASEHQTGLVVDDGLLLVASESMTVSAYGGAEPDEARWRAWWEG